MLKYNYTFSDRLKAAREYRGYKQTEVAEIACLGATTYNHYETGKTMPDVAMVFHLADVLGCPPSWLLGERIIVNGEQKQKPWDRHKEEQHEHL